MTRLILLNGPPGIGKSTLAALWADRHPGTLNLDVDALHPLVGGWQHDTRTHDLLRPVALAMAGAHLAGGHDVIIPQFLSQGAELDDFARVAADVGAATIEIALLADRDEAIARFGRRSDDTPWGRRNLEVVAAMGGETMLGRWYDQLQELLRVRPMVIVRSEPDVIEVTYDGLVAAVENHRSAPSQG